MLLFTLAFATPPVQDGDIVFHRSKSSQSAAIAAATGSSWTHTGIVRVIDGEPWVFEAVQPVKLTRLAAFEARGDGPTVVKRAKQPVWDEASLARLDALQASWLGRPYDLRFEPGTDALYCSELVREAYLQAAGVELAPLRPVASYEVGDPALRRRMVARWGAVPEAMLVVAPSDLFASDGLIDVPDASGPARGTDRPRADP